MNGTTCRIDVYMRGYSGTFVQNVVAAADPFFFEEDDSDDLLNDVLRYRTGYIRLIEQYDEGSTTALTDIYPTEVFDRYVEVYYGQALVFNGYIQVQDFSNALIPVPRVIELPVISPLGLYDKRTFSNTSYQPPSEVSLGALLNVVFAANYSNVYLPKNYGQVNLGMKVSTLVAAPWNKDFHYSMNQSPASYVQKGQTYQYIIEAICKAFGWICHDTPDAVIFTAFDYEGLYCYFPVGHIGESEYSTDADIPSSASDLTDYFELADNAANETKILPDTGIEISYEGEYGDRTFSFDRMTVPDTTPVIIMPSFIADQDVYPNHAEIFSLCSLVPVQALGETNVGGTFTFDNNDKLSIGTHCVAWNGQDGFLTSIGSYESGRMLFYVRFYLRKRSGQKFSLSYDLKVRRDGMLGGLNSHPEDDVDYYINTSIDTTTYSDSVKVTFSYRYGGQYAQLPSQALIFISNINLEVCEQGLPYEKYLYKPAGDSDVIPASGNPAISSNITMPISLYRLNDNLIGTTVRSTKVTEYPYLFTPRKELVSKFIYTSELTFPHVRLFTYMNKKWRIIAQRFDPWNDEIKLTMQHSSVL